MGPVAGKPAQGFGGLLRQLRDDAGLTQEELAEAASLSPRSVSDLERGISLTARKETARLLANALGLAGPQRAEFEAVARGRAPAAGALAAGDGLLLGGSAAAVTRTLPRDIASFTGRAASWSSWWPGWPARHPAAMWWGSTRSAGWPGSARPPSRCTPRTSSRRGSRTGSSSCRCTRTLPASGRWIPRMRW